MSLWRQVTRGLRVLVRRSAADRDLDDEMQHYLAEASAAAVAGGSSVAAAQRTSRLQFGSMTSLREEVRSHGWEHEAVAVLTDLRYAVRGLRRHSGFAIVAILTLALGIGASTAIFSAVYPVLFAPLPYPHADRVVMLSDQAADGGHLDVTYGTYEEVAQRSRSFAALAIADRWQPALMETDQPERLSGDRVSTQYFRALGVAPTIGRDFDAADDLAGTARVVIVSDGLARRRFGGAQATLGRSIILDGDPYDVIGVMPPGFDNVLSPLATVWTPRRYRANAPFESAEWGHHLRMIGRLAPGASLEQVRRELTRIGRTPVAAFARAPWAAMRNGLTIESLQGAVTRAVRPALLAILAAVLLVLAIAAVNVANLLLARGAQRRPELAMRATLGASRGRLARQLLTESMLLAVIGGALGLIVAAVGVRALMVIAPAELPRATAIHLNAAALLFTMLLAAVVGIVVGIAPALQGARRELHTDIRSGARTAGTTHPAFRRVLVIAEIALALVVLVGAGLMLRSIERLFAASPGFNSSHLLTLQVAAVGHQYDSTTVSYQLFGQILDAVRHVPGVTNAALTNQLPLSGDFDGYGVELESTPRSGPNDVSGFASALRYSVTPGWFSTMGIPLREGRLLGPEDRSGAVEAVVLSESFAKSLFPGKDPIGQRMRAGPDAGQSDRPWAVVVGVAGDVKQTSLALGADDAFYVAMGQWNWIDHTQSLVVRTTGDPTAFIPAIKRAIWSVDPDQPISRVAAMAGIVTRSEAQRHFVLIVFTAFGISALLLAAIGIFGLVSGGVTERLRELGVRAALGASRGSIVVLVLGQGMSLAGAGIAIGLAGAALVSGLLQTLLFGISRGDLATYLVAASLVLVVAVVASAIPAWRAARVDPAVTLRA